MYYVYILHSEADKNLYIRYISNLTDRYDRHVRGNVPATKGRRPVRLIFYEAYVNKYDALRREKYYKTTKGKSTIKTMPNEYFSKS